ncbi:phage tail tube protein [Marinifilum flexuosum]|uniref:Phage tail tube protein n=1 Tax=Marinifilum flexuosum TaxID=1117708 RepID=A0A419X3G2_9BACT|nr:phage tail tube protein [Marinifilum flexuosum]RKE02306.1 phage tail tube protein [Marinifilum flexuosum]
MSNTGIIDGGDILVYVETAADTWTAIGHATSCKLGGSTSFRERRTKDTNGKESAPDETETQISVEALALYDGYSFFDMYEKMLAKEMLKIKYAPKDSVAQTGDKYVEGNFWIESCERNDNVAEDSVVSIAFKQKETPTVKTVPV